MVVFSYAAISRLVILIMNAAGIKKKHNSFHTSVAATNLDKYELIHKHKYTHEVGKHTS